MIRLMHRLLRLDRPRLGSAPDRDSLVPVLVRGGGRNGTTLLMQLLATSPRIAMERRAPFETRYLTYLMRWRAMLDEAHTPDAGWNEEVLVKKQDSRLGPWPWVQRDLIQTPHRCESFGSRCFQAVWREFSHFAIRNNRPAASDDPACYYAEKAPAWVAEEVDNLLPARLLYPVRDPRDVWISVCRFDEKRGFFGFGRKSGDTEGQYMDRFIERQRPLLRAARKVRESRSATVVRYERMATHLREEAERLGAWLGVSLDAGTVERNAEKFQDHMTSRSPQESVERWKREMPADVNRVFVSRLGDDLAALGYDTGL